MLVSGSVVKDTDLVIEAIVENIAVKHKLFKQLDSVAPQVYSLAIVLSHIFNLSHCINQASNFPEFSPRYDGDLKLRW